MASDVSFMQYMRAHGNTPGPTQRPYLTGVISGLIAEIPSAALLYWSGALSSVGAALGMDAWLVLASDALLMVLAGVIYAAAFKRAANDRAGGWLFGIAFGFLLWTFAPVTIWQVVTGRPVAVGRSAAGLFFAEVLYGLVLGLIYPRVHSVVQKRLGAVRGAAAAKKRKERRASAKEKFPEVAGKMADIRDGK